jgi:hypothetical protein
MAVPPTPLPDKNMAAGMSNDDKLNDRCPIHNPLLGDMFGGRYRQKDHVDSFAEKQMKLAKQTSEAQLWTGRKLLEAVQGKHLILSSTARWRGDLLDPSSVDYHVVVLVPSKVRPRLRSTFFCPHDVRV